MTADYRLKCPKCGSDFDVNYHQLNSLSDPNVPGLIWREGAHRFAVRCASCRKRSHYHKSENGEQLQDW